MKKLIAAIVIIFIAITTVSCVAVSKKTTSTQNQLEKSITVYTTESNAKMQYIADQFKKTTGITVDYKIVNNLTQAVEQSKNDGTNVDVIYGGDESDFENLATKGLLVQTPVTFGSEISNEYKNKDGYWYGTSLNPMVMYYNTAYMLPQNAPSEWYQLGQSQYYNRIVMPNTNNALTESLLGSMSYKYSKSQVPAQYNTFAQGLRNNILAYGQDESAIMEMMKTNKEAALSIGGLAQVNSAIQAGAPFKIINATEGSPMTMQGVGVINGSKNINSAKLFIEFIAGPNMQLQLANKFNVIPTITSVIQYAPKWMANYNGLNIANIDWNTVDPTINNLVSGFNALVKSPKAEELKLELPVVKEALIPSQQKLVKPDVKDQTKAEQEAALAKEKATEKKAQDQAKAKQTQEQQSQAQKAALQSLQSLGETSM